MILDCHCHKWAHGAEGILNSYPSEYNADAECLQSVGIHPWHTTTDVSESLSQLHLLLEARHRNIVAVGECGIDKLRGGTAQQQHQCLVSQIEMSETFKLPLILHIVRAWQEIIELKRTIKPSMPWVIHGFRGKATVAKMLIDSGFYLSIGHAFNPDSLAEIPLSRVLLETDESTEDIRQIAQRAAEAWHIDANTLIEHAHKNLLNVFNLNPIGYDGK